MGGHAERAPSQWSTLGKTPGGSGGLRGDRLASSCPECFEVGHYLPLSRAGRAGTRRSPLSGPPLN